MILADIYRFSQPRIAVYSQDGYGLGHMRRTSSIVRQFLQVRPDASVLTFSDSPLGQVFETAANHDYLKLPSIVKIGPGSWRAMKLAMPFEEVLALRRSLIRSAILDYRPHLLLVDHMPHGAMGELTPALEAIRANRLNTRAVLGLRDILDSPDVIRQRWQAEHAYETLERYYDQVLVYGMREVYDITKEYSFKPEISSKLHYCGYVCTPAPARYATRARSQLLNGSHAGTKLILVMAGGGADAYTMMNAVMEAVPYVSALKPCVFVMVTGPFMPPGLRHDLDIRSRNLPVKVRNTVSDILSYIEAADLVISMAGYNSTMEILRSGKPAILIPRAGPSAEQQTRASLFAERGWVQYYNPVQIDSMELASAIHAALESTRSGEIGFKPNLDGIHTAVGRLNLLLGAARRWVSNPHLPEEPEKAALQHETIMADSAPS